ncbi:MAG TPA: type VI secretion system tip protein TssI/VgrG [Methylomirabilota bacterium]|jgi:type VI secretion system secreted protein VgrG
MARLYELTTPLGKDVLLFREMRGHEELGRVSEFDLTALSTRRDIGAGELLGKSVTVKVELRGGGYRYFNGYVVRFAQGTGRVGRYYEYRMALRSWQWFLTRTSDCRIFQEKTVPDIVKEVFADHSVAVFEDGLSGSYSKREYCVQYRETDFDFVSRLLEEEGIYYYVEHQDGRHTVKLVDSYSGHKALEYRATIAYYPPGREIHAADDYIHDLSVAHEIQTTTVALDDYDFTKPKADLAVKAKVVQKHEHNDYEVFDPPGEYHETGDGEHYARARINELHSQYELAEAACNVREIAVGRLFNLTNAPWRDQEREYLIVKSDYEMRDNAYETAAGEGADYRCVCTVLQSRQQFRPSRVTPRPMVRGPQTAVVVGPSGEEIWCDKYGRVKVQFHWDRYGKKDENSSCWIRVSSQWAGGTWGQVSLPRIGQEVIVDFLEGDPDQPIIIGRVYNADLMPPYTLPANQSQSGIKSRSTKGGSGANFNEIRFEDKKGAEVLTVHAEKDQDISVENDESHSVGHDRTKSITHDETTTVGNNRTETVGVNEDITIGVNRTEKVGVNETITVGSNRTRTVGMNEVVTVGLTRTHSVGVNEMITIGAAQEVTIGGAQAVTVGLARTDTVGLSQTETYGKSQTTSVGTDRSTTIGDNCTTRVGKDQKLTVGDNRNVSVGKNLSTTVGDDEKRSVGKTLKVDVGDEVVITCGQSSFTMKKDGTITIKGKAITIDAMQKIDEKAMNITSEASAKSVTKGAMVNVEASGINTIKGSLVKIN